MGVSHVAIQFPLYEVLKAYYRVDHSGELGLWSLIKASSFSKIVASSVTYPVRRLCASAASGSYAFVQHEVIRTRFQVGSI